MVGIPMFAGFISKLLFAQAGVGVANMAKMMPTLIALAISTVLNAVYFMKTVIRLYTPERKLAKKKNFRNVKMTEAPAKSFTLVCFIILNLILGLCSEPIVTLIGNGLKMFA